jgi:cytochrome c
MKSKFEFLTKSELSKSMLTLSLAATGFQFIFGPLLFLTLPTKGVTWGLFWVILAGAVVAVVILFQFWKMIKQNARIGTRFYVILGLFAILVAFMGTGRHMYREAALKTHKTMVGERTAAHWEAVKKAHENLLLPSVEREEGTISPGEVLFKTNCAVCHAANTRLVGPSMAEASAIYKNDQNTLKLWIKNPGRKRMDYPAMTGFPNMTEQQLTDVSTYVLENEWN